MITMTWTAAPADLFGLGGSDVRAFGSVFGGRTSGDDVFATVATAGADARLRPACVSLVPAQEQPRIAPTYIAPNDGTTLGIHSPGRPQS